MRPHEDIMWGIKYELPFLLCLSCETPQFKPPWIHIHPFVEIRLPSSRISCSALFCVVLQFNQPSSHTIRIISLTLDIISLSLVGPKTRRNNITSFIARLKNYLPWELFPRIIKVCQYVVRGGWVVEEEAFVAPSEAQSVEQTGVCWEVKIAIIFTD